MNEASTRASKLLPDKIQNILYWTKVITGIAFGTLSYFVIRFTKILTWYIMLPSLLLVTLGITTYYIQKELRAIGINLPSKRALRTSLKFTGTWILAYFTFATLTYFVGW
ncbi:MAG: hypothetical protein ACFE7R_05895 [Candidatus Hodarchaeota archaeon]